MDSFKPLACLVLILALFSIVQGQNCNNYNLIGSATTCSSSDLSRIYTASVSACSSSGGNMNSFVNSLRPWIVPLGYNIFVADDYSAYLCYNQCYAIYSIANFNVVAFIGNVCSSEAEKINMASFNHTIALTPKKV